MDLALALLAQYEPPATEADAATLETPARAPVPAPPRADVALRIPAIGVDAAVIRMGVDASGVMEVPHDAALVAWYEFTAFPGNPGNAVLAAHVDYRGSRGAFAGLSRLAQGDVLVVRVRGEELRYVVERTYMVRPEAADLVEIIGLRSGPETLTLITCGGEFDRTARAYEQRVIVRAVRVG